MTDNDKRQHMEGDGMKLDEEVDEEVREYDRRKWGELFDEHDTRYYLKDSNYTKNIRNTFGFSWWQLGASISNLLEVILSSFRRNNDS